MQKKLRFGTSAFIFTMFFSLLFINCAYCSTLQFTAIQDSYIDADNADVNYGSEVGLYVEAYDAKQRRTLIQFDLSTIPSGVEITSATLKLYYATYSCSVVAGESPGGRTYWAYQVTQPWTGSESSWSKYDGTNSWTTAGGDYTETGGGNAIMPSSFPTWVEFDVTTIVEAWVEDSQPNYGFLIKDGDETLTVEDWVWASFRSSEYSSQADKNPILEITYTQSDPNFVVPEVPLGSIVAIATMFTAFGLFVYKRKQTPKQ